jgi:spermidine synthase
MIGMAPQGSSLRAALYPKGQLRCKVFCIGLGGGSLPLFLSHHFPGMDIEVVEIDPVVIAAAQTTMGFPADR